MRRACLIVVLALAAPLTPAPAAAQDGWGWSIIIPSVARTDILGTHLSDMMAQQEARNAGKAPAAPAAASAPSTPAADPAKLRFTPTAEARAANFRRLVDQRRAGADAATLRQFETLLADPAFMREVEGELRKRGLRADSMADAFAIWWIQAWQTVHGQTDDPSPAAIRAVQAQAQRAMLTLPGLLDAPDAGKQAFAEGLLVQAVLMGTALEQVKGDPTQVRRLAASVRTAARAQAGLDLTAMALTDAGFTGAGVAGD